MFNASRTSGFYIGSLAGVPVRVSIWFLVVVLYWAYSFRDPQLAIIWGSAIAFSVLVHEFGHALLARYYKLQPSVLLHGLGGLCIHERAERDRHDALIVIAGPAFGLILGGLVYVGMLGVKAWAPHWITPNFAYGYMALLWINIIWSGVNLLPLWPLDGGLLFRLGLLQFQHPVRAEKITHSVSLVVAIAGVWYAYQGGMTIVALLAAYLGYLNIQQLGSHRASGAIRPKSNFARELLSDAEEALEAEDWREASRLCYQIRDLQQHSPKVLRRTWQILTIATAYQDEHERALRYAEKTDADDAVERARLYSLLHLGRVDEADDLAREVGLTLDAELEDLRRGAMH